MRVAAEAEGWFHKRGRSVARARISSTLGLSYRCRLRLAVDAYLLFEPGHFSKPLIPAPFEIAGNQTIVRVYCIILPMRASRFIARLLQRELQLPQFLRAGALTISDRLQGSLKTKWRNDAQDPAETAASIRMFPNAMHFVRRPWLMFPSLQT